MLQHLEIVPDQVTGEMLVFRVWSSLSFYAHSPGSSPNLYPFFYRVLLPSDPVTYAGPVFLYFP